MTLRSDLHDPDPALDEDIEEQLRAQNPKGRLLERCAQLRIARPETLHRVVRGRHQVEMSLAIDEWEIASGTREAWTRIAAEHLAAHELLAELDELRPPAAAPASPIGADDEEVWDLEDGDEERLRAENPKGALLSWCAQRHVARARFEARTIRGGHCIRATHPVLGAVSPWFRAPRRLAAEQAAAEALLSLLPDSELPDGEPTRKANLDPRSILNERQQRGLIAAFHVDVVSECGPPHARIFTARAHVILPDGTELTSAEREGKNKRDATVAAAREVLSRLP